MLALLDRFQSALQDFAGREEKLNGESRARTSAETKAFEAATQQQAARLSERITDAEAGLDAEKKNCRSKFEKRKARITQAHLTCNRQVMEGTDREGRQKHWLQKSTVDAERNRDAGLANAAATLDNFKIKLAESREIFALLEKTARSAFRGYGKFRRLLAPQRQWPEPNLPPDENQLFGEFHRLESQTRDDLNRFKKIPLPRIFKYLPMWLLTILLLGFAASVPLLHHRGLNASSYWMPGATLVFLWVIAWMIHQRGKRQAEPAATVIAGNLAKARRLHDGSLDQAESRYRQEQERITKEFENTNRTLNQQWKQTLKEGYDTRGIRGKKVDEKGAHALLANELTYRAKLKQAESNHTNNVKRLRQETDAQAAQFADAHAAKMAKLNADNQVRWQALETEWNDCLQPIYESIRAGNAAAEELFPDWQSPAWKKWTPPQDFKNAAKFGRLEVDVAKFAEVMPKDRRLALPGPSTFSVPLALAYPLAGSILFEAAKTGGDEAIETINNVIFRLLSTTPPGKLSFTIFDPVGLGQNFAALMHLADYEESYINSRIWTQTNQIEEKLAELNEHMEKVIQMYLRNEYETITEYNAQAGSIAEKYHFLVIASFPVNFSDTAARRLRNIAASGARCGVYTLIHWDQRHTLPPEFVPDELRKNSIGLVRAEKGFELSGWRKAGTRLVLDKSPSPEFATQFLNEVGQSSKDSNRVEVPFDQVAPPDAKLWTEDTTEELTVPIGRSGATKLQQLAIGKGTRQHALVAGKTGSGKSTLFHVVITNLALWCSPEQVEFYLVDFKKGVEFKAYARAALPHARVVAIESER